MITKAQAKYSPGVRVEVLQFDFSRGANKDCPEVWMSGTVDRVEQMTEKLVQVFVMVDSGGWSPQIVGPRGGNNKIRIPE